MRYLYLHGFGSDPTSEKAQVIAESFRDEGLELEIPNLNAPSFSKLSHSAMIEVVDQLYHQGPLAGDKFSIIGSSLGGWVAARYAELYQDRVDSLVLLCPAFHMSKRTPGGIGQEGLLKWERDGSYPFANAKGEPELIHFGYVEEARLLPGAPDVHCPTLIIHGLQDHTVPISFSREYAASHENVRLLELDDGHTLMASLDRVVAEVERHFEIGRMTMLL